MVRNKRCVMCGQTVMALTQEVGKSGGRGKLDEPLCPACKKRRMDAMRRRKRGR